MHLRLICGFEMRLLNRGRFGKRSGSRITKAMPDTVMLKWRGILVTLAIIDGLAACWLASEVYYTRSILPMGVVTVRDFFARFG